MPRFAYTARDPSGQSVSAVLEASTRKEALRLLAVRGLTPLRLSESADAGKRISETGKKAAAADTYPASGIRNPKSPARLGRAQRLPFLQALSDLTASGLSAGEAVRLLSQRIQEPALRALCQGLWERLSEGLPLSRAMEEFPTSSTRRRSTSSRRAKPPAASTRWCSASSSISPSSGSCARSW